jgi:hypothetical protein
MTYDPMPEKTKNDVAWGKLFEKYDILANINQNSFFEIESTQINEFRESRLMAKFDHKVNLPLIFRNNNLSILPISRSKYVIGKFETHHSVAYDTNISSVSFEFPDTIETIDYSNLYSEGSVIHCAYITGMIDYLVGENTSYTVSGRMSTEKFNFKIRNKINNEADSSYTINVENSQCEIDAGFESESYFILIETKNESVKDFLIRQLYYPYRLWVSKTRKKVIPVLMTYSYDLFSFFIYKFIDDLDYNSIQLVKQVDCVIASEIITTEDVSSVFNKIDIVEEPTTTFPQADRFDRVVDLLGLLFERELSMEEISGNYQFSKRQADYYTVAGIYIGLIKKYRDSTRKTVFSLTEEARKILKKKHKAKYLELISKILEHEVFYKAFQLTIEQGEVPSKAKTIEIMSACGLNNISGETISRRASTVRGWTGWVWSQIE